MAEFRAEFTLEEIARIALGAPDLSVAQISVFHSLIDTLLKKLNCENEKITLTGSGASQLQEVLERSKYSTIVFDEPEPPTFEKEYQKITQLEQRIDDFDTKLTSHLHETAGTETDKFMYLDCWDKFPPPHECACSALTPENEVACRLMKKPQFMKELLMRISQPMVTRLFAMEQKMSEFSEEFSSYIHVVDKQFQMVQWLYRAVHAVHELNMKLEADNRIFYETMEEIQDILDSKLDKIHMTPLKKYIMESLHAIQEAIGRISALKHSPKATGIIWDAVKCTPQISDDVKDKSAKATVASEAKAEIAKKKKAVCVCFKEEDEKLKPKPIVKRPKCCEYEEPKRFEKYQWCKSEDEFVLGSTMKYYRKG